MAEYIEREAALQIIDYAKQLTSEQIVRESGTYELLSDTGKAFYDGIIAALAMCKQLINEAVIAADVQPVVHGQWLDRMSTKDSKKCSICGNSSIQPDSYCSHCGAKMDGDE